MTSLSIKEEYIALLKSGMFWEFYPQLSGDYEVDEEQWKMIYYNLTISRKIPSVPKEERYKSNVV